MTAAFLPLLTVAAAASIVAQSEAPPPTPQPSPTPVYHFVFKPTPAPVATPFPLPNAPEIDEIDLNDSSLTPPAPLHVRVLTSAAVISVTAETFGHAIAIPQHDRGVFLFDGYIPDVPSFLRNRSFDVQFTATVVDGRSNSVTIPLALK